MRRKENSPEDEGDKTELLAFLRSRRSGILRAQKQRHNICLLEVCRQGREEQAIEMNQRGGIPI
jgi:hypothetical protein